MKLLMSLIIGMLLLSPVNMSAIFVQTVYAADDEAPSYTPDTGNEASSTGTDDGTNEEDTQYDSDTSTNYNNDTSAEYNNDTSTEYNNESDENNTVDTSSLNMDAMFDTEDDAQDESLTQDESDEVQISVPSDEQDVEENASSVPQVGGLEDENLEENADEGLAQGVLANETENEISHGVIAAVVIITAIIVAVIFFVVKRIRAR